jgi:hypothetical protein
MHRLLIVLTLALLPFIQAEPELQLSVRRTFGFSSGSQIQGTFRLEVTGPDDLAAVTFLLDGDEIGTATAAPFRLSIQTDAYPTGFHTFTARGETTGGRALTSNERRFEFVTAAQGWEAAQRILTPLLAIVGGAVVLSVVVMLLQTRSAKRNPVPLGAPRNYGVFGGTICPKCSRPFARHVWGLNLGLGKLDRCDHCGRWSLTRALPLSELRAAEAAEKRRAGHAPAAEESPEARLRRQLDESRFTDTR